MLLNSGGDVLEVKKPRKCTTSRSQRSIDAEPFRLQSQVDRRDFKTVSTMIDEKQQQQQQQQQQSTDANKSTADRPKSRRSLFSVLFHGSGKQKQQQKQDDADQVNNNNNNSLDISSDSEIAEFLKKGDEQVKGEPDEGDSYELELDDRVALEKSWQGGLTIRKSQERSPPPASQRQSDTKHIPQRTKEPLSASSPESAPALSPVPASAPGATARLAPKSPLLEQFLNSHKIQLNSMDSNSDDELDEEEDSSSESLRNPSPTAPTNKSGLLDCTGDVSARDLRLVNWRLMAAKSMWSASSLPSSDSELDLLDCHSPALVVTCSDDTSCSSVELIWTPRPSRPPASSYGFAALDLRPSPTKQHLNNHHHNHQTHLLRPTSGSSGVSLKSAHSDQSVELVRKVEPKKVPDVSMNDRPSRAIQRLSIFELAKPNRAKGKQIGRRRSETKRPKTPIGPSSVHWVANPLFSNDEEEEAITKQSPACDKPLSLRRCASHESVIIAKPPEVKQPQQVEVQVKTDEPKEIASLANPDTKELKMSNEQLDKADDLESDCSIGKVSRDEANDERDEELSCDAELPGEQDGEKKSKTAREKPTSKRDNIYLNHIINLDKRIKSNVSSLKSQFSVKLSDTGKRASVFADQLIASIKDTTKETQELFGTTSSRSKREKTITSSVDSTESPADNRKAKLFSLIYMHQQHANGQPVITRQPLPTGGFAKQSYSPKPVKPPPPVPPRPSVGQDDKQTAEATASSNSLKSEKKFQDEEEMLVSCETNLHNSLGAASSTTTSKAKVRRKRRARCKPATAPPPSSDDEGDFYQVEYNKLRFGQQSQLYKSRYRKRSLNYWRRFRMRQLGLEWKLVREDGHRSFDLRDLMAAAGGVDGDDDDDYLCSYRFERTY